MHFSVSKQLFVAVALFVALTAGAVAGNAQVVVRQLGNMTQANNSIPFGGNSSGGSRFVGTRFQTAYTKAELNLPKNTKITEIRVHGSAVASTTYRNFKLRLAHATLDPTQLTWNLDTNYVGTMTTCIGPVGSYALTSVPGPGFTSGPGSPGPSSWYVFTFTTPFIYDGVSNVVVDWEFSDIVGAGFRISSSGGRDKAYQSSYWGRGSSDSGNYGISFTATLPGLTVTTQSPVVSGFVGKTYTSDVIAGYGTAPYSWQGGPSYITAGALPPGLSASIVTIASGEHKLRISGKPTAVGDYVFSVRVTDNASPAPKTVTEQFEIHIFPAAVAAPFSDEFDADRGWALTGQWSRGVAVAYSASSPTRSEPSADHSSTSDNRLLGHNRGGDYANGVYPVQWAVSPPVNCSGLSSVRLRFYRWLGIAAGDAATIEVSNNAGVTWKSVWSESKSSIADSAWTQVFYDISAVAAGKPTVQVRFGLQTDGAAVHVGWSIDDLKIEEPGPDLEVREGGVGGTLITDNQNVGGLRDFGVWNAKQTSTPLTIVVTNMGLTKIDFPTGIVKAGANPGDFYIKAAGTFPASLQPGQTGTFTIEFYRTTAGVSTASIEIEHNASGSGTSPFQINVRGEAITPVPVIEVRLNGPMGGVINHQDTAIGTVRDFGNQDVSAGPTAAITICVVNAGTGALGLTTPSMGGTSWNHFVINAAGFLTTLAPGASTTFEVAFDPGSVGAKDAVVWIAHNDASQPTPFEVPVLGNGTSPGPTLNVTEGGGGGTIAHNAAAAGGRDFGSQHIAVGPTTAIAININNTGTSDLIVGTPVLGGSAPSEFVVNLSGFASPVTPGNSTSFTIAFDPTTVGQKDATVSFTHNDPNTPSPFIIKVTGNGINTSGVVTVREVDVAGAVLPNPAPAAGILDFGSWATSAGPTAAAVVYVENTGTGVLTLGVPSLAGSNPGQFKLESTGFAGALAVGASRTFKIRFDPSSVGGKNAVVEFSHDDFTTSMPYVLNVTGNGQAPAAIIDVREGSPSGPNVVSADPATPGGGRDCGSIDVSAGATAPVTIFIVNSGTKDLSLGTPAVAGQDASSFALVLSGFTSVVSPGASASFDVTFDPALGGMKDAQVEFTQDDSTQPSPYIVKVRGTAIDPNGVKIDTSILPAGASGTTYGPMQLSASQGASPYVWSIYSGAMPPGLSLSAAGEISGVPSGYGGHFEFIVRVSDQTGATDERTMAIDIVSSLHGRGKAGGGGGCAAVNTRDAFRMALLAALVLLVVSAAVLKRRRESWDRH